MSRYEYQRQSISPYTAKGRNKQKKAPYQDFWDKVLDTYEIYDDESVNLYSDDYHQYQITREHVVPPHLVRPPMEPAVQKLFFRKPYDVKRKPFRHLVRPRVEPSPLHKVLFRTPHELKEEIFRNISTIHSLNTITEGDQHRLNELFALLVHLNKHDMYD